MSATLPLCVVGAGLIGMRHVDVAHASEAVRLTAVVEADTERRAALTARGLPMVASLADVPPETRAAVIATPTPDHHLSGQQALSRGMALLVEKPLVHTLDAADALIGAAEAAGLLLVTGHHRRCHPFAQAAREALGRIGDLVAVQGLWSVRKSDAYYDLAWRRRAGSGPLMTNLSHEIDLMRFLIGEITEATTLASNARRGFEIEDTAAIALRFANGALGSFLMSDAGASPWSFEAGTGENPGIAASGEDYMRLTGTEGALAFPSLTLWGRSGPGEIEWSRPLHRHAPPKFERVDPIRVQLDRFAAVVGGAQDDVLCDGAAGRAALEMTLAAALSAREGKPVRAGAVPGDFGGV